jgi:hypothetical protein
MTRKKFQGYKRISGKTIALKKEAENKQVWQTP